MAKHAPEILAKAKALFEAGKPLRDIETEVKIPFKTIGRIAKKEGWVKGELTQLISSMTQDRVHFDTLEPVQKDVVSQLVSVDSERVLKFRAQRDEIAALVFNRLAIEIPTCEVQHLKSLVEAHDKNCVTVEIAPRFNPNASVINNNTNAQQNNDSIQDEIISRVLNDEH